MIAAAEAGKKFRAAFLRRHSDLIDLFWNKNVVHAQCRVQRHRCFACLLVVRPNERPND
jgi:hypothetical protein